MVQIKAEQELIKKINMKINTRLSELKEFNELDEEVQKEHLIIESLIEELIVPYFESYGYSQLVKRYFYGYPHFFFLNRDKLRIIIYSYYTNFEARINVRIDQFHNEKEFDEWTKFATWNSSSLDWYLHRKYKLDQVDGIPTDKLFFLSYYSGENFEEKIRNILRHSIELMEIYVKDIISGKKDLDYSEMDERH